MSKVSTKSTFALLGALLATGAGLILYKNYSKNTRTGIQIEEKQIDRETIIKILKELQKELFTVFQNFASVSMNIMQQSMGRASPKEIKQMLLEQPMFRSEIEQVEDMVYQKFGLNREQFQYHCQLYREDKTILDLQNQMKKQFDDSFKGVAPDPKTEIPDFLNPEKTFEILEKIMTESALKLNEKLLELQQAGEVINFQSPKMMEVMQSLKMDSSKKDILDQYGLNNFEDPGSKILQYATQVYSASNQGNFNAKMKQLDMKYQAIMEQLIMQGPMSHEELKQRMQNAPAQHIPFQGIPQPQVEVVKPSIQQVQEIVVGPIEQKVEEKEQQQQQQQEQQQEKQEQQEQVQHQQQEEEQIQENEVQVDNQAPA